MIKKIIFTVLFVIIIISLVAVYRSISVNNIISDTSTSVKKMVTNRNPFSIEYMKNQEYKPSPVVVEERLPDGNGYEQYVVSFNAEGYKEYALLTKPLGEMPEGGYSAIIFNHGYIPPEEYATTERYVAYIDALAGNGFVVFKPDYRGHGQSEGSPTGAYFSPGYTIDVLTAFKSVQNLDYVNPQKIGMWGHSMGGYLTMRSMVIDPEIKSGVIWGGVVGSYGDMQKYWWSKRTNYTTWSPSQRETRNRSGRQSLIEKYGQIDDSSMYWKSISPVFYLESVNGPIQLHHGLSDETVPWELSKAFEKRLREAGKKVEYYEYQGGDHNISSPNFEVAMERTVNFFKESLK